MRKAEINYNNTENLINNLRTILDRLDDEQRNVKQALGEIYDLENYYRNRNKIIDELEFRERKIHDDIRNTEELIKSIELFSRNVQETDERLAHKFKQDIKSYAKQNNIELVSEFDKWLDKAQMALDGAGIFPFVGEVSDAINGAIYLAKGDIGNAGISFLAMLPVAGDSLKSVRYLDKASDVLKFTDKAVDLKKNSKKISKTIEKTNPLLRGDDLLYSSVRPNGMAKSYISKQGDLIPASIDGMYKGRKVTVTEHILGGYRRGAKGHSPYTSFTFNEKIINGYGNDVVKIDISGLRKSIQSGKTTDVVILKPKRIEKLIKNDKGQSEFWKNRALNWTRRDSEYLIKGKIPSEFIKIVK